MKGSSDVDGNSVTRGLDKAADSARAAGRKAGESFGDGFNEKLPDLDGIGNDGGRAVGDGFSRGISGSGASTSIGGIGARLIALVPLIAIIVGALSSLASGFFALSSAIAPATATLAVIPGVVLAAASAFGILKASFSGIGNAFKLGLKEQDNAVATGAKNANAMAAAARAVERAQRGIGDAARQNADALRNANRAIEDARRNLANTMVDSALRAERSDRSLFLAERSLRDALEKQAEAQVKLTEARKDARDEIISLQFALEDSILGQERAAINLEKARRQLQLVSGLPPDNLLRKQAELDYKEAELNVRKTADTFRKATDAADQAQKDGVENSEKVVSAQKSAADSAEAVADAQYRLVQERKDHARTEKQIAETIMLAQRGLADAVERRDKTLQENARRTQDAQEALADALRSQADAAKSASPAMSAYNKALQNLAPAQRDFVKYLMSIRDTWKSLKADMAENVLRPAQAALEQFMEGGLFDIFKKGILDASKEVGRFFTMLEDLFKSPMFKGDFQSIMDSNTKVVADLVDVVFNLVRIFFSVTAAAGPMTERFSEWVKVVTGDWADKAAANGDRMRDFFQKAGDTAAQLGRIFKNIGIGIYELGKTAAPAGQELLDAFEGATEKFSLLTATDEDKKKFKQYFLDVADNVKAIGSLVVDLIAAFGRLGDNKGIGQTAEKLRTGVLPVLESILDTLNGQAAPAIADFMTSIAEMFKALSASPALEIFLGTLTTIANVITAIATNPAGKAAIVVLGTIAGIAKSISLVRKVFFVDQLISGFKKIDGFIKGNAASKLKSLFKGIGDDAETSAKRVNDAFDPDKPGKNGKTRPGVKGNTPDGVDKKTKKAGDDFADNLSHLRRQFKLTGDAKDAFILNLQKLSAQFARTGAAANAGAGGAAAAGAVDAVDDAALAKTAKGADKLDDAAIKATKSGGKLSKVFGPLKGLASGLGIALTGVGGGLSAILGPVLLVVGAIAGIVLLFKGAWDHSEKLRSAFNDKLKPALEKLWKAVKPAVDAFKEMVEKGLKKLGDFIADTLLPILIELVDWIAENIPPVVDFFVGVFDWISEHWDIIGKILFAPFTVFTEVLPALWDTITKSFQEAVDEVVGAWNAVTTFFSELPGKIAGFFVGIWDGITGGVETAVQWVVDKWNGLIDFFKGLPGKIAEIGKNIWDWIVERFETAKSNLIANFNLAVDFVKSIPGKIAEIGKNIWNWIVERFETAKNNLIANFNRVVDFVRGLPSRLALGASRMWNFVTEGVAKAYTYVRGKFDDVVSFVAGIPRRIGRAASGMWDGIKNAFRGAINWIVDRWNSLSFSLPSVDVPFFGRVGGFTLNTPNIPRLAQGGIVPATPGGILANIGEGGKDERVQPLSANGLTKGEEMMLDLLRQLANAKHGDIHIHASDGMDIYTLAKAVSAELGWQGSR